MYLSSSRHFAVMRCILLLALHGLYISIKTTMMLELRVKTCQYGFRFIILWQNKINEDFASEWDMKSHLVYFTWIIFKGYSFKRLILHLLAT